MKKILLSLAIFLSAASLCPAAQPAYINSNRLVGRGVAAVVRTAADCYLQYTRSQAMTPEQRIQREKYAKIAREVAEIVFVLSDPRFIDSESHASFKAALVVRLITAYLQLKNAFSAASIATVDHDAVMGPRNRDGLAKLLSWSAVTGLADILGAHQLECAEPTYEGYRKGLFSHLIARGANMVKNAEENKKMTDLERKQLEKLKGLIIVGAGLDVYGTLDFVQHGEARIALARLNGLLPNDDHLTLDRLRALGGVDATRAFDGEVAQVIAQCDHLMPAFERIIAVRRDANDRGGVQAAIRARDRNSDRLRTLRAIRAEAAVLIQGAGPRPAAPAVRMPFGVVCGQGFEYGSCMEDFVGVGEAYVVAHGVARMAANQCFVGNFDAHGTAFRVLPCHHVFCQPCFARWPAACATCRAAV